jgi:hypothetical protein
MLLRVEDDVEGVINLMGNGDVMVLWIKSVKYAGVK